MGALATPPIVALEQALRGLQQLEEVLGDFGLEEWRSVGGAVTGMQTDVCHTSAP